jgi:hypothetical protein
MPVDESLAYYWTSLGLSAAGVVVFLWLLLPARKRKSETGASEEKPRSDIR